VSKPVIQSLPSCASDARRLASRLGLASEEIALHRFPDGEMRVTVGPAAPTTVIYASLDQPNDKLLAILFAAEALRRAGAQRLVLLAPYLCYMRQDAAFHQGEAISQRAVGRLLAGIVDRVITVDAHLHRTADIAAVFPGIEADNLSAMPVIASDCVSPGLIPPLLWSVLTRSRDPGYAISRTDSGCPMRSRRKSGAAIAPSKSNLPELHCWLAVPFSWSMTSFRRGAP
jgi:ribose-phosphate pyrophosphokinase